MGFLHNSVFWSIVSVIEALVLGVVAIVVGLRTRSRKALSYEVVSDVPVVTVQHSSNNVVTENIKILYNDEPVRDVRIVVVRLWNSGNQEIVPTDYVEPITITFWGKILASDVIEASPSVLKRNAIAGGGVGPGFQAIGLKHLLLNRKDSLTIQALVTDFSGQVDVSARIVGVSSILNASPRLLSRWQLLTVVPGVPCIVLGMVLQATHGSHASPGVVALEAVSIIGMLISLAAVLRLYVIFFRNVRIVPIRGVWRRRVRRALRK